MNNNAAPSSRARRLPHTDRGIAAGVVFLVAVLLGTGIAACAIFVMNPASVVSFTVFPGSPGPDAQNQGAQGQGSQSPALSTAPPGARESQGAPEPSGELPTGSTVFDGGQPGISGLDPLLLEALQEAATAAGAEGIELQVNSGWRSPEFQRSLWEHALVEHGSADEAARWVAPPEVSAHVTGDAADIGPFEASYWLSNNGAKFGLCQIYANENWHFELRPTAAVEGCPEMLADAAALLQ